MNDYPITFWYGIPKAYLSKERILEAKEAGMNIMECRYDAETNKQVLRWCEELGVKADVHDTRIDDAFAGKEGWETELSAMAADYRGFAALNRYFIKDEPVEAQFEALARVGNALREVDPDHDFIINLLPTCAVPPLEAYEHYVEAFLDTVKPTLLSYDHYSFMKREVEALGDYPAARVSEACIARNHWEGKIFEAYDREGFYDNLEIVRRACAEHEIPFMAIILLVEHWNYRWLTEGEIRSEVMATLAYGSSELSYFTYWTPGVAHTEPWSYHHAMINSDGTRDEKYDMVKGINRDVQAIMHALNGRTSAAVFHVGEERDTTALPFTAFGSLEDIDAERLLVGCFDEDYFLLCNKDHDKPQTVILHTEFTPSVLDIARNEFEEMDGEHDQVLLTLAPGDAALIRF